MARTELRTHPKFKRLCRDLDLPAPYVMGLLEMMWQTGYIGGSDVLGDEVDVEAAAEWPGEPGAFFKAVRDRWVVQGDDKRWRIHDFWDHAPQYVQRKAKRKPATRRGRTNGKTLASQEPANSQPVASRELAGDQPMASSTQPNPTETNPDKGAAPPDTPIRAAGAAPSTESSGGRSDGKPAKRGRGNADDDHLPGFDRFWAEFPPKRKRDKSKCRQKWKRKKLEREADAVLNGLAVWKRSDEWTRQNGEFVPMPATWLNNERWQSESLPVASADANDSMLASGVDDGRPAQCPDDNLIRSLHSDIPSEGGKRGAP